MTQAVAGSFGKAIQGWETDLEKALVLMNKVMPELDTDGFRCWNGERVTLNIGYLPLQIDSNGNEFVDPLRTSLNAIAEVYITSYETLGFYCEKYPIETLLGYQKDDTDEYVYPGCHVLPILGIFTMERIESPLSIGVLHSIDPAGYDWWVSNGGTGVEPLPETKALFQRIDNYQKNPDIPALQMYQKLLQTLRDDALCYPGIMGIPTPIVADSCLANIPTETIVFQESWDAIEMWFMR